MKPGALPVGWYLADAEEAKRLLDELHRELPRGHVLHGVPVDTFAHRRGATDDVLFRHVSEPDRFTIIHLTWIGRTELDARYPRVEYDGSFDGFMAYEKANWGLEPHEDN